VKKSLQTSAMRVPLPVDASPTCGDGFTASAGDRGPPEFTHAARRDINAGQRAAARPRGPPSPRGNVMHADQSHDAAELSYPDRGTHRLIVRGRCWPLPSDSDETQLALPAVDARAGAETAMAGTARVRARRRRPVRRAKVVIPPVPREPAEHVAAVPMQAFDELRAASLACAEPGGSGQRNSYECIVAIVAAERAA
jgi:hypothetical protein